MPEHTHIPVRREAAHPGTGDASLPDDRYARTLDPWVALATAATVPSSIRLATAVALPVEHDPITLAKTVATLDHLSCGRTRHAGGRLRLEHRRARRPPGADAGPKTFAWIARSADGWMTTPRQQGVEGQAARLQDAWAAAGRIGAPKIHVLATSRPDPERLATWEAAGVTHAVWGLPDRSEAEVVASLARQGERLGLAPRD